MKKTILILIMLLTLLMSLFAWKELDFTTNSHNIIGHISGVFELSVSNFYYAGANGGKGLNLDINDEMNNNRFLIAPTQLPKSVPGLLIGTFSLISSSPEYKLTISHDKLANDLNSSIKYDYELCAYYSVLKDSTVITHQTYCVSDESAVINFNDINGILMLQNAGLYFRLCTEVVDEGTYTSLITLVLESLQ